MGLKIIYLKNQINKSEKKSNPEESINCLNSPKRWLSSLRKFLTSHKALKTKSKASKIN